MCSACFPRLSLPTDASLSSTGSSEASSPASTVLSRHYDFLPPVLPRFVAFAWQYLGCTRRIRSLAASAPPRPGVGNPVSPAGKSPRERQELPSSWRTSKLSVCPCSVDSGGTACARPLQRRSMALGISTAKAPTKGLSKLNSMAFGLAVYASQ